MSDPNQGGARSPAPADDAASELVPSDLEEHGSGATLPPTGGAERGEPSPQLKEVMRPGTPEDTGDYEGITDAAPETGVFHIVGGYLDDNGVVHSEVHLRSMDGEDEDLLGNRGVAILDRLNTIVKNCTRRIGTITERGQIGLAIDRLPIGSRTHLLICLRRTTHWKRTKDIFTMDVRCPYQTCQKMHQYAINLASLRTFDMPHPEVREHSIALSNHEVVWRIASTAQEKVLDLVTDMDDAATLTYAVMVRLVSIDGRDARLSATDLLTPDHKQLRFSPKAKEMYQFVRKMSVGDREDFRASMLEEEPGIDTSLEFTCKSCRKEFDGALDIAQEGFWFPSVTSRRSKMRSST